MAYSLTAEWVKGTNNDDPDGLLMNTVTNLSTDDSLAELDTLSQPDLSITEIRTLTSTEPLSYHLDDLKKSTQKDIQSINNSYTSSFMNSHTVTINCQILTKDIGTLVKALRLMIAYFYVC